MLKYVRGAELPPAELWWLKADKTLIDFSTGVISWEVKIIDNRLNVLLTKTTGITGDTGSGTALDGEPNVLIEWDEDDLDIAPGKHKLQVKATTADGDRIIVRPFEIIAAG